MLKLYPNHEGKLIMKPMHSDNGIASSDKTVHSEVSWLRQKPSDSTSHHCTPLPATPTTTNSTNNLYVRWGVYL